MLPPLSGGRAALSTSPVLSYLPAATVPHVTVDLSADLKNRRTYSAADTSACIATMIATELKPNSARQNFIDGAIVTTDTVMRGAHDRAQ